MRFGLSVPPFTDPAEVVRLASRAEASGWDGFFLWDHLQWDGVVDAHDPWVLLGAIARETERLRLGTMVTPLSRRRPQVVAKHVTTLDHLSGGRAVLGVGLGDPPDLDFSDFGDEASYRVRAEITDEALTVLGGPGRRPGLPPRQPPRCGGVAAPAPGTTTADPDLGRGAGTAHPAVGAGQAVGRLCSDRRPVPGSRRPGDLRRRAPP